MARQTFEDWVPIEYGTGVLQRPTLLSAIERAVPAQPMSSETKWMNRSGSAQVTAVPKGSAFPEDAGANDHVLLSAVKFGVEFRIANEDVADALPSIIEAKKTEFATSFAVTFDNACLGTTGAGALTAATPFNSLYKVLRTTDAGIGYTADANYLASPTGSVVSYPLLSQLLGLVESSNWYDANSSVIIAHNSLRGILRGIMDTTNRPIFLDGAYGGDGGTPQTLFNLPIYFTNGARTSGNNALAPTGNPLVAIVNPNLLMNGTREGVTAIVDKSAAVQTDEALLIMKARKGFAVSVPQAHAILEIKP